MSKADRHRKRQKAKQAMPALAPVKKRAAQGKKRMTQLAAQEPDAPKVVLEARARHVGVRPRAETLAAMRSEMLSEPAGQAIWLATGCGQPNAGTGRLDAAQRLWRVYARLTAAEYAYQARILGRTAYPKCARIEAMPERFETRADDRPDLRREEERDKDTVNNWMRWQGHIGQLPGDMQTAIWDIVRQRREPVQDAHITMAGDRFVRAVGALVEVVERRS